MRTRQSRIVVWICNVRHDCTIACPFLLLQFESSGQAGWLWGQTVDQTRFCCCSGNSSSFLFWHSLLIAVHKHAPYQELPPTIDHFDCKNTTCLCLWWGFFIVIIIMADNNAEAMMAVLLNWFAPANSTDKITRTVILIMTQNDEFNEWKWRRNGRKRFHRWCTHISRQFVGRCQAKCSTSTGHAKNSLLLLKVLDSHWMRMHGELW
jgi:hypothetical protein